MPKFLQYTIECRSCFSDLGPHAITVMDGADDSDYYEGKRLRGEYEMHKIILGYLVEGEKPCDVCGSYNLELSEISYWGKKAMIGTKVTQHHVVINRTEGGEYRCSVDGQEYVPRGFLRKAYDVLEAELNRLPTSLFEERKLGGAHFVVSTYTRDGEPVVKIERFKFHGINKKDLTNVLSVMKGQQVK